MSNRKSISYSLDGEMENIDITYDDKPIFRKYTEENEINIATILQKHPHPNIVTFYKISDEEKYLDMELLDTDTTIPKEKKLETMSKLKEYLQSIGVIYIDWKPDQVGLDTNGTIKLYDFDASGVVDKQSKKWIIEPPKYYWSYKQADKKGLTDPYEIDNYAFTLA